MSNSLRDQLLGLGYQPAPKPERKPELRQEPRQERNSPGRPQAAGQRPPGERPTGRTGEPRPANRPGNSPPPARNDSRGQRRPAAKPARTQEEIDLGKAYALRAQKEKDERIEAERLKQEQARQRREAKAQLGPLLKDQALNAADADIARHFEYGGKIKRIHVTAAQLQQLNAGQLGVAQLDGRYLLIPIDLLLQAEAIFPQAVALKVDPDAPASDDPYSDPAYQVPDDLVW